MSGLLIRKAKRVSMAQMDKTAQMAKTGKMIHGHALIRMP